MQHGFYRYALLAGLLWVAVERAFTRTSEKLERDRLEHHCERSLKLCVWSGTHVSLLLLTGEARIVNPQGSGMHWYLS